MTCDHKPAKETLTAFRAACVRPYWLDDDGEGGIALYANCKRCASTIAIAIQEVRASVVTSGEIKSRYHFEDRPQPTEDDGGIK